MEVYIKYKAISYEGEPTSFVEQHTCPDFKILPGREFDGYHLPGISIESQVIDWLDSQDKYHLIYKHDLMCILDYEVFNEQSITIPEFFESLHDDFHIDEDLKNDIIATYAVMKENLRGVPFEKQVKIIFDAVVIGHKASAEFARRITAIFDGKDPDEVESEPLLIDK